jgi:MFS family permease
MRKHIPTYEWWVAPHWMRRWGPLKLVKASLMDRVGLHFYSVNAALNGVMIGALSLAGVVLKDKLNATDLQMGIFTMLSVVTMLFGIVGSELAAGRDKRPFIIWFGMFSRGAFLLFLFCYTPWTFILIIGLFHMFNALVMPATFAMWQANVSSEARNRLWGLTVIVTTLINMVSAYIAGTVLDWNSDSFRWLFPAAGLMGMLGMLILGLAPLRRKYKLVRERARININELLIQPVGSFIRLMRRDRRYLNFEMVFFLYGLAVMLLFPVIPMYIVEVANMSYAQAGIATGILGQLGVLTLSPVWGWFMDRTGPFLLCIVVFSILAVFPLVLLAGMMPGLSPGVVVALVYCAHLIFGSGMSGINVAWSMGPVMFAGDEDSSGYSGAHVTITGIRGLAGPMMGALGKMYLGFGPVLATSAALFLIAAIGMYLLRRHYGPPSTWDTAIKTTSA